MWRGKFERVAGFGSAHACRFNYPWYLALVRVNQLSFVRHSVGSRSGREEYASCSSRSRSLFSKLTRVQGNGRYYHIDIDIAISISIVIVDSFVLPPWKYCDTSCETHTFPICYGELVTRLWGRLDSWRLWGSFPWRSSWWMWCSERSPGVLIWSSLAAVLHPDITKWDIIEVNKTNFFF